MRTPLSQKETRNQTERVLLTNDILIKLHHFRDKFGFLPNHIFKHAGNIPTGLNPHQISRWMNQQTKTISETHLEWVFGCCERILGAAEKKQLPKETMLLTNAATNNNLVTLTEEHLAVLEYYRDELGFLPGHIFKFAGGIPEGVDARKVSAWLNRQIRSADPSQLHWVVGRCHEILEF